MYHDYFGIIKTGKDPNLSGRGMAIASFKRMPMGREVLMISGYFSVSTLLSFLMPYLANDVLMTLLC